MKGAPYVMLIVPIEGRARAILVSDSFQDERALAADLAARDLLTELAEALRVLADVLAGEAA